MVAMSRGIGTNATFIGIAVIKRLQFRQAKSNERRMDGPCGAPVS